VTTAQVKLPSKVVKALGPPRGAYQYRVLRGGRGSGKSVGAATVALLWGYADRMRILCVRQFQNSIKDSFYAELIEAMDQSPWLAEQYNVTKESITGKNGTQFIFKGLDRNPQSIKSLAKVDLTIVEEAEDIPEQSWINLEATVFRQPQSELWAIYNPKVENSPVDKRFIKNTAPRSVVVDVNWSDNPFFPSGLDALRRRDLEVFDYATYAWIWEGAYLKNSKAQIYHDKFNVKRFEPGEDWDGPYQGLDWGYSQDPTAMIRAWVHDECLYIEHESGDTGIELDDVPSHMPCEDFANFTTRADSAQPSMISHVRRKGMPNVVGAKKGKGSVEDGIQFIRSFRNIYVHPRCKKTLNELNTYSWKVDRLSGDILTTPVDASNHWMDALRYALEPIMRTVKRSYIGVV
jgi:phage terminase large subunit